VSCTLQTLTCTFSGSLRPYEEIEVDISVSVRAGAHSGEENTATVSGGGGSHPFQLTSVVTLNTSTPEPETEGGKGGPRGVASFGLDVRVRSDALSALQPP
jgi:hypothetical protein